MVCRDFRHFFVSSLYEKSIKVAQVRIALAGSVSCASEVSSSKHIHFSYISWGAWRHRGGNFPSLLLSMHNFSHFHLLFLLAILLEPRTSWHCKDGFVTTSQPRIWCLYSFLWGNLFTLLIPKSVSSKRKITWSPPPSFHIRSYIPDITLDLFGHCFSSLSWLVFTHGALPTLCLSILWGLIRLFWGSHWFFLIGSHLEPFYQSLRLEKCRKVTLGAKYLLRNVGNEQF